MKRIISIAILVAIVLCSCGKREHDISGEESEVSSESHFESEHLTESSEPQSTPPEQSESNVSEESSEESNEASKSEEIHKTPENIVSSPILFWDTKDKTFQNPVFIGGVNKDGFHSPEEFIYNGKHLYSLCDIYGETVDTNAIESNLLLEFYDSLGNAIEAKSGKSCLYHEEALPLYLLTNEIKTDKKPQSRFLIGSLKGENIFKSPERIENGGITIDLDCDGESERLYLETKKDQDDFYSVNVILETSRKTLSVDEFQYAEISSVNLYNEFFFADIDSDSEYEIIVYYMFNDGHESFISVYDVSENGTETVYTQTVHYLN